MTRARTGPDGHARLRTWLRRALLAGAAATLAGCTTAADRRVLDEDRCQSYGFRPRTEAFSKCLLDLDLNRDADRRAVLNGPYFGGYGFGGGFGYGFGGRRDWR